MSGTDATGTNPIEPITRRIVYDVQKGLASGRQRQLIISPPATGKTTAAIRLAFSHFLTKSDPEIVPPKVLYIGSNPLVVQDQCQRLAMTIPNGKKDWDFAKDGTQTGVVGITWRQLINADLDPRLFSFVIADDAHHGLSPNSLAFLEKVRSPIVGFSNSTRYVNDTLERQRKDTNIVFLDRKSPMLDFFGDPTTKITYGDLDDLGISKSVSIRTVAHENEIMSINDPRIEAIAQSFGETFGKNGSCKTLIYAESIEQSNHLQHLVSQAITDIPKPVGSRPFNVGTYHSGMTNALKARTAEQFESAKLDILIHCKAFEEGHVFNDLALIVVAGKIRSPHVYERVIGRIFHSTVPERQVLDLIANPANFVARPGHPGRGNRTEKQIVQSDSKPVPTCSESTITFGTSGIDPDAINTDSKSISPMWTRESAAEAIASLHTHNIGNGKTIPTREQIDIGAQRGLCPPTWIVFSEHGRTGFFVDGEDLAKELGRMANQYDRSKLTRKQVMDLVREQWKIDPPENGLFSKEWLEPKCDGVVLPFRLRTIIGSDTLFPDFTSLTNSLRLKGKYFRRTTKEQAIEQLKKLYKKQNGKKPIATPNRPLTIAMIARGSKERICPSPFNLLETQHGNKPIFPGGLDEVNRLLGFTIFTDLSKQEVLDAVNAMDKDAWPDRRFPASQSEILAASKRGDLPFSTKHIIGEKKFWKTKRDFDFELGYHESPFYYRSLRQQIRFGTLNQASR